MWPWKQQNSEISIEFEGSEAGIVKNPRKMNVLGGVAGRRRESLQGGETAQPGSNRVENVRFGAPGPFPGPWRPMPPLGPSFWTLLAWSQDPKMRAGNLLAQPTGPNRTIVMKVTKTFRGPVREACRASEVVPSSGA